MVSRNTTRENQRNWDNVLLSQWVRMNHFCLLCLGTFSHSAGTNETQLFQCWSLSFWFFHPPSRNQNNAQFQENEGWFAFLQFCCCNWGKKLLLCWRLHAWLHWLCQWRKKQSTFTPAIYVISEVFEVTSLHFRVIRTSFTKKKNSLSYVCWLTCCISKSGFKFDFNSYSNGNWLKRDVKENIMTDKKQNLQLWGTVTSWSWILLRCYGL